jgi:hypothetical protein
MSDINDQDAQENLEVEAEEITVPIEAADLDVPADFKADEEFDNKDFEEFVSSYEEEDEDELDLLKDELEDEDEDEEDDLTDVDEEDDDEDDEDEDDEDAEASDVEKFV